MYQFFASLIYPDIDNCTTCKSNQLKEIKIKLRKKWYSYLLHIIKWWGITSTFLHILVYNKSISLIKYSFIIIFFILIITREAIYNDRFCKCEKKEKKPKSSLSMPELGVYQIQKRFVTCLPVPQRFMPPSSLVRLAVDETGTRQSPLLLRSFFSSPPLCKLTINIYI